MAGINALIRIGDSTSYIYKENGHVHVSTGLQGSHPYREATNVRPCYVTGNTYREFAEFYLRVFQSVGEQSSNVHIIHKQIRLIERCIIESRHQIRGYKVYHTLTERGICLRWILLLQNISHSIITVDVNIHISIDTFLIRYLHRFCCSHTNVFSTTHILRIQATLLVAHTFFLSWFIATC